MSLTADSGTFEMDTPCRQPCILIKRAKSSWPSGQELFGAYKYVYAGAHYISASRQELGTIISAFE